MKIVHCLTHYMPDTMAGTEVYVHKLAVLQKKGGMEVSVITPHIEFYRPGKMNEHYEYEGIDVYQFMETASPKDRQVHYGNKRPEGLSFFSNLLEKLQPDIVHFHELNRSLGFTIDHVRLARQKATKIFLTMHLSSYSCNTNLLIHKKRLCEGKIIVKQCTRCSYETLYHFPSVFAAMFSKLSNKVQQSNLTERIPPGKLRSLFSIPFHIERIKSELQDLVVLVDRIICISEWYKKVLLLNDVPEEKITVVQPALTHEISHLGFPQEKESRLPIRFVFIGRLLPIKGIHTLIEAFREFQQEQVVLDIYGEFDDENYRERCLSMVQSNTVVHFKGKLSRNEVIPILKNYDMFCLASASSEMSPLVIQEAFAAGIPVLASRVYGNMEQVRSEENGLLFEFDSVDSLRSKVKRLLSDPQILKNLKSNIVSPREFSLVVEDYLRIYESSSL